MLKTGNRRISIKKMVVLLVVCTILISIFTGCSAGGGQKQLSVLCFQGYADDTWVKPFEQANNCKVTVTYGGSAEEMFTKAKAGGAQYDTVSIDCGAVQRYYDAGLISSLDMAKIPNTSKLSKFFKDADYKTIDGKVYHSPIVWGANNIVYNKDKLGTLPDTWGVLWDPKYKGQVSTTDEANNNVIMTAMYLGFKDPYNLTEDQMAQVKTKLIELKKNCRTLSNGFDTEKNILGTGETLASVSGFDSGLIMYLRDQAKITPGRITPKEGIYIWIDGWVMLKNAKNPDLVQKWMDYILSDEVQVALAKSLSFGAVTPAGKAALDPDVVKMCNYDDIDSVKVPISIMKTSEDMEWRTKVWNEAKAAQ